MKTPRIKTTYEIGAVPQLAFTREIPRASGKSPYRAALAELLKKPGSGARFKDGGGVRTALRKGAEVLGLKIEYALDGAWLWVRLAPGSGIAGARDGGEPKDLAGAVMLAIRELPRTQAEIADRVCHELWTDADRGGVSKEIQRLISSGLVHKSDDLKHHHVGAKGRSAASIRGLKS